MSNQWSQFEINWLRSVKKSCHVVRTRTTCVSAFLHSNGRMQHNNTEYPHCWIIIAVAVLSTEISTHRHNLFHGHQSWQKGKLHSEILCLRLDAILFSTAWNAKLAAVRSGTYIWGQTWRPVKTLPSKLNWQIRNIHNLREKPKFTDLYSE